jgi:hypothetical protein
MICQKCGNRYVHERCFNCSPVVPVKHPVIEKCTGCGKGVIDTTCGNRGCAVYQQATERGLGDRDFPSLKTENVYDLGPN